MAFYSVPKLLLTVYSSVPKLKLYCFPNSNSRYNFATCFMRLFHASKPVFHGEFEYQDPKTEEEVVMVNFVTKDGKNIQVRGKVGDNVLYLGKRYGIDVEGACEGSLACTTCHVYVEDNYADTFPTATETEEDLLDAAPFLKENSRLGCQLILGKEHDGVTLKLPAVTRNFYVDGHQPSHH